MEKGRNDNLFHECEICKRWKEGTQMEHSKTHSKREKWICKECYKKLCKGEVI